MSYRVKTLQRKLYQLIICRLEGKDVHSEAYRERILELVRKGIGGFIVFGGEREGVKSFIDELRSLAEIPLFIASDIERGVGQQIKGCTIFPCQMAVSAAIDKCNPEDARVLRDTVRAVAIEAIDVGINMPLIPVLDINSNPDNPIICTRAFSDNPEDVSWFGAEYIQVIEDSGLISCAKHFPGHGDTAIDSHIALPVITESYDELMETEIVPFIEAVNAGVRSIMIGHLALPSIDSVPASFSGKIITDLLRKELSFEGLIMTDALNMSALAGYDNVPVRCLKAGVDILLHPADPDLTVKQLEEAIGAGMIDEGMIDTALERIMKVKTDLSRIKKVHVDYSKHNDLSEYITKKAITLAKGSPELLPLHSEDVQLIVAGEDKFYEPSVWEGNFSQIRTMYTAHGFLDGTVILAIFSETSGWKGRSGIDDREKDRLMELVKSAGRSVVISFGSPYVLRHFKYSDVLIAAYDKSEQSQRAVINCLKGKEEFKGRLPVKIFK